MPQWRRILHAEDKHLRCEPRKCKPRKEMKFSLRTFCTRCAHALLTVYDQQHAATYKTAYT